MMPLIVTPLILAALVAVILLLLNRAERTRSAARRRRPMVAYGQPFARQAPDPKLRRDYRTCWRRRKPSMRRMRQS